MGPMDVEMRLRQPFVSIFLRPSQGRPRKGTRDVFPLLLNRHVSNVEHGAPDRILRIDCGSVEIRVHLFGGSQANVLLLNGDSWVVDSLRNRKVLIGHEYRTTPISSRSFDAFGEGESVFHALSDCDLQLGSSYAASILREHTMSPHLLLSTLSSEARSILLSHAERFRNDCLSRPTFQLVRNQEDNELLSLHELQGFRQEQVYDSVSEAIRWRVVHLHQAERRREMLKAVNNTCTRERHRLERALAAMQAQARGESQADHYQFLGDLLLSQLDVRQRGLEHINLLGWDGESVPVRLDPTKDLKENAELYYTRARRARESKRIREEREPNYRRQHQYWQNLTEELQTGVADDRLRTLYDTIAKPMKDTSDIHRPLEPSAFRQFELAPGYRAYVGKDSKNNDELTMKFAKQNDLWFHARGVSGSHVVLRSANSSIPKNIIEMAASLAAYYSKARNAKYCPVVYTQRKYVRKPKGAAVGAVRLEREEVIMVEPKLYGATASELE